MKRRASSVASGSTLSFDVCVVGGGPAGLAVVQGLRGRGLSVCLLESGGESPDALSRELSEGARLGRA
jgi:2-polyprenyl-6-methoxyphenol hydroxylase-like FAD-dependent oxidoreductase